MDIEDKNPHGSTFQRFTVFLCPYFCSKQFELILTCGDYTTIGYKFKQLNINSLQEPLA